MRLLRLTPDALLDAGIPGPPIALVSRANLALGPITPAHDPRPTVCWSGWLGEPSDPERGIFPRDFRTWSRDGWDALSRSLDAMLPTLREQQSELWLRPNARHILADPQACFSFLRTRELQPVRIVLDAAAFLTGSMLDAAEDHLARAFQALGAHPGVCAVLLSNVRRADPADDDALGPAPLHRGLFDPSLILKPWRASCPPELPCILIDEEFDAQAALLA